MGLWKKNVLLLLAVLIIGAAPLLYLKDAEFGGTDDKAEKVIEQIAPEYQPWFGSLIQLPGGELESLLFALQAAIGAGILGFVLGRITAKPQTAGDKDADH